MNVKCIYGIGLLLFCLQGQAGPANSSGREWAAAHNGYRARVGSPPLVWSDRLAVRAQQWAATLIARGLFVPRRDGQSGENLYEISGGHAGPAQVVAGWMSEEANYNRATNSCTARCGHYTQVIWHDTKSVGCGVARDGRREVWVCDYTPPGNIVGERPY